jgi:hypothetical protein
MKNEELDAFISRNLQKCELEIPDAVQARLRQVTDARADRPRRAAWKRGTLWGPLLAAAILAVAVALPQLFPPKPAMRRISQIRTEISIPEKNIKVIWMQRDDFRLTGRE